VAKLPSLFDKQVAYLVLFEVSPNIFSRIEFWSIGGMALNHDVSVRRGHVI